MPTLKIDMDTIDKEQFLAQLRAQMQAWQARFEEFQAKGQAAKELGSDEYEQLVDDLRQHVRNYERELKKVEEASDDSWRKIGVSIVNWFEDLDDRLRQAMQRLK